ncbi:MAG: VWA domain-containing protein, partial [Deltaproteobacteria bacterium]|nr:VWA domain-containing protein [Deltaproteobacteria bacterium]
LDDEDTDLHGKKKSVESTPEDKIASPSVHSSAESESLGKKSKDVKTASREAQKAPSASLSSSSTNHLPPAASSKIKFTHILVGAVILLLLVDTTVESLGVGSPLSKILIGVTLAAVLSNLFFILKRGNPLKGLKIGLIAFLGLMAYTTWKYGSGDWSVLTTFGRPPSFIFNFIFLGLFIWLLLEVLFRSAYSFLIKGVLSFLILYGMAGILENLLAGIFASGIWSLEDTLLGTRTWQFVPQYFLRPTLFAFYVVIPLFILYFLFSKKNKVGSPVFFTALLLVMGGLAHIILWNHRIPNVFSLMRSMKLGVGQAQLMNPTASEATYELSLATSNILQEQSNDRAESYRMAGVYESQSDGKRLVRASVRDAQGHEVPFLKSADLILIQDEEVQKNAKVTFLPKTSLQEKNIVVLLDRSSASSSVLPHMQDAVQKLWRFSNSREKINLISFSTDTKSQLLKSPEDLKKAFQNMQASGNRNLAGAFTQALQFLEKKGGDKSIFLITTADAVVGDDTANLATRMKSSKIRFFSIASGDSKAASSLTSFAESTGGSSFSEVSQQKLSTLTLSAFSEAYPNYEINFISPPAKPKFKIVSPDSGLQSGDVNVLVKVLNPSEVKLVGMKIDIDGTNIQQLTPQAQQSDYALILPASKIGAGSHELKVTLISEDGKEYVESTSFALSSLSDFRFIRPMDGDSVSGRVNLEVFYQPNAQSMLSRIDFLVDGQKVGEVATAPYLFTWETSALTGVHQIQAQGIFADGTMKSDQMKVNVSPGLSIRLTSPTVGEFLSHLTDITAEVVQNLSETVQKVEFYVDGQKIGEATQAPYKYLWDNSQLASGQHVVQARAFSSNKLTSSDAVVVNIGTGTLSLQPEGEVSESGMSPNVIEWIIDASSSMNGMFEGISKIDFVKQSILRMISRTRLSSQMIFRWYGSQFPASHNSCKDSVLGYPLSNLDMAKVSSAFSSFEAKGLSDLAYALDKLKLDMKSASGTKIAILIT